MRSLRAAAVAALLLQAGCVPHYVVPEPLDRQVDRGINFSQLRQDAERYKGASVVLGGEVLNAKNLPEGTEIEVLQLPLDASDRPISDYEYSEGRFLLLDPERRDPVVLRNRLITVVGEVVGTKTQPVDEAGYVFPYLSSRFIRVWRGPSDYPAGAAYPYYYPSYYPGYYPYAYPYAPSYYWDPWFWSGSFYYYDYHGPSHYGHSERRFNPPAGGGSPAAPSSPPSGYGGGGGGGGGRRFK